MGVAETIPDIVPLDVSISIALEPPPVWVPALVVGTYVMKICGEGGSESDEELEGPEEESGWGLGGL